MGKHAYPRSVTLSRAPGLLKEFDLATFRAFVKGKVTPPQRRLQALSTFSSAGIGDYGYRLAGFSFRVHGELVRERLAIYGKNHPRSVGIAGDLNETWPLVVDAFRRVAGPEPPALLTGMSPCQGMSTASSHERKGLSRVISEDPRNLLPFVLMPIAKELRPRTIVVENVPGIMTTRVRDPESRKVGTVASLLSSRLVDYACFPVTLQFADYGVPQRRSRTLLTYIRKGEPCLERLNLARTLPYPNKSHDRLTRSRMLPWITAREFLGPPRFRALSSFSIGRARDPVDSLHYVPVYDKTRFKMVKAIPPHSGKSAYENDTCAFCGKHRIPRDQARCVRCSRPLTSRPIVMDEVKGPRLIVGHPTSYKRMPPSLPVSTVTTSSGHLGSDSKIHPWENRLLSPRECAEAQTIPRTFEFGTPANESMTWLLRQAIGEAMPPWFGYLHGLVLRNLLGAGGIAEWLLPESDPGLEDLTISDIGEREAFKRRRRSAETSRKLAVVQIATPAVGAVSSSL